MEIKINDIFQLTPDEIKNSRIELNMVEGPGGQKYIGKWLALSEEVKESGDNTGICYWSWYSSRKRNFVDGNIVFSFCRMETNNRWLFLSAAEILSTTKNERAKCKILDKYKPFFGRLIINCYKGGARSNYCFKLKTIMNKGCTVTQVLESLFGSKPFPGYADLHLDYRELKQTIYYDNWKAPLSSVFGIYLLNDKTNGKKYVGSASGVQGIFGRWSTYLSGGYDDTEEQSGKLFPNSQLKQLVTKNGLRYIEDNFEFSILEIMSTTTERSKIIDRENHWKNILGTKNKNLGYNSN